MSGFNVGFATRTRTSGCRMTEDDHAVLQRLASGGRAFSERYRDMLGEKLRSCIVYPSGALPGDVVRLNTCFTYAIDGSLKNAAILVPYPPSDLPPIALSLHTIRGLALMGLAAGEAITTPAAGVRSETIEVVRVLRQPAAPEAR